MINLIQHTSLRWQAAILCSCLLLMSCENDDQAISEWTEKKVLVEEAKKVEAYFSQGGRMRARLNAPLMLRQESDTMYTEFPKTLHVDFYDSLGKRESWLDARYGKHFENLNKVFLRDSVVVINTKGDTLTTSELWWDQNSRRFYTDKHVRIAQTTRHIYGEGLEANQDLTDITILKPSGIVLVNEDLSAQ